MPELIEVEVYRRVAERVIGKKIAAVDASDAWFLKRGIAAGEVTDALTGATISATRRVGKLLLVDLDDDRPVLGLRFGMTGRLIVDDESPIEHLLYTSRRDDPRWNRFGLTMADGTRLRLSDPRRLGGVELDPDLFRLGPDAWTVTVAELRFALGGSAAPLKARLLDQSRLAGLGNLLVDETLWRAGLDPARAAGQLGETEERSLARTIRSTVTLLFERGGSHTGDLQDRRFVGGVCPADGTPLARRTIGGRTTYSCPRHQV